MPLYTPYVPEAPSPVPSAATTTTHMRTAVFIAILVAGLLFGGVGAWATLDAGPALPTQGQTIAV